MQVRPAETKVNLSLKMITKYVEVIASHLPLLSLVTAALKTFNPKLIKEEYFES
jgi:hypothetical protein